jgi:predicted small lipoprotein YifL
LLTILFIFASCGKKGDPKYVPESDDKTLSN